MRRDCGVLLQTEKRGLSVSVTVVSRAKTAEAAERIEMPFGLRIRVGSRNHVSDGGPYAFMGRGNFGGGRPIVKNGDTAVSCAKRLNQSRCRMG